jgi:hypothetical protein
MAKAVNDATDPAVRRNNKGEIISWTSSSDNGRLLWMLLVENGNIKPGMTAGISIPCSRITLTTVSSRP